MLTINDIKRICGTIVLYEYQICVYGDENVFIVLLYSHSCFIITEKFKFFCSGDIGW